MTKSNSIPSLPFFSLKNKNTNKNNKNNKNNNNNNQNLNESTLITNKNSCSPSSSSSSSNLSSNENYSLQYNINNNINNNNNNIYHQSNLNNSNSNSNSNSSNQEQILKALSLSRRFGSNKLRNLLQKSMSSNQPSSLDFSSSNMMKKSKIRWKCYTLPNDKGNNSVLFATGRRKKHSRAPTMTPEFIKKASHHTSGFGKAEQNQLQNEEHQLQIQKEQNQQQQEQQEQLVKPSFSSSSSSSPSSSSSSLLNQRQNNDSLNDLSLISPSSSSSYSSSQQSYFNSPLLSNNSMGNSEHHLPSVCDSLNDVVLSSPNQSPPSSPPFNSRPKLLRTHHNPPSKDEQFWDHQNSSNYINSKGNLNHTQYSSTQNSVVLPSMNNFNNIDFQNKKSKNKASIEAILN